MDFLISFHSCKKGSGFYCAKVDRYNPKTGSESSYTLKVEIEDQKLIKIYWHNQGYLDGDDFNPTLINGSKVTFTDKQGSEYKVYILDEFDSTCFADVPKATRRKDITTKNKRCNNQTDNVDGYCHIHLK